MKKFSLLLLFSFFLLISNVNAEYYLIPNSFEMNRENNQLYPDFDFYGINNGVMSSVKTLNGLSNTWYRFEILLDGSNCSLNSNPEQCTKTINDVRNGSVSSTTFGSFNMCVSKPQFHFEIDWSTCNDNCLKKSDDLIIINKSYQECTLGLYNTETGGTLENDGYLVTVYFDVSKWQYIDGAYSAVINGRIYLYNDSDSILYYRFINDVNLSDINMSTFNSAYGIFNHDYSIPDVGGETFLNNGTCVLSYNKLDVFKYSNNWNRDNEVFTFNDNLSFEQLPNGKNLWGGFDFSKTNNGITFNYYKNGTIKAQGISSGNALSMFTSDANNNGYYLYLPAGTYTVSGGLSNVFIDVMKTDGSSILTTSSTSYNRTFTLNSATSIYLRLNVPNNVDLSDGIIIKLMLEKSSYFTSYQPYGGYFIEYDNLNIEMGVFHYYDTNLNSINNMFVYLEDYEGDYKIFDMVNCRNNYVCKYENVYSFTSELLNIFNPERDNLKKLKIYYTGNDSIYFKNPYLYDMFAVPGRATWDDYYQPYGQYICSDNDNGTYYNAQTKKVYFNPDNPPKIVSSNPNGQSQNIFGIEVNFYGLSSIFSIPIDLYNNIKSGNFNNCTPLTVPFPGFPDKDLVIPCMTEFVYERYPSLLSIYRIIIYGFISLRIARGTIIYIKKWYDGTIESGD